MFDATDPSLKQRPLGAIILAAGRGTRMNSDLPKVVHEVAGKPMVWWVVRAVREAGAAPIVVVVGHGAETVREIFAGDDDVKFAVQEQQLGTGHATLCARDAIAMADREVHDVLVLAGDGPLIQRETIRLLHARHVETAAAATLATSVIDDPTGYGRVVRDKEGGFSAIVEQKNADDATLAIREIYPSYACFNADVLFEHLESLPRDEVTGEYYITAVPMAMKQAGLTVEVIEAVPPQDVLSINTPEQLAEVDDILRSRTGANAPEAEGARS